LITPARRLGLFSAVGCAGFLLQIGTMLVLTRVFDWHFVWAALVAVEAAIVHNYFAHTRWTWADRPPATVRERLVRPLRYQGTKTLSLAANVALTALCVAQFGVEPVMANVIAVGFCAFLNYQLSNRVVFVER
jgi:putative flippase GtrA